MKLIALALPMLLVLLLASCHSPNNQQAPDDQPAGPTNAPMGAKTAAAQVVERWKLTRVVQPSMIAGKADTSSAPPYQEIIELRADSTFRRTRSNGYAATGKYTTKRFGPGDEGLLATFDDPKLSYHELPGYRQNSHTEGEVYLRQESPGVLVESYAAADGPAFYYEKAARE